MECFEQAGDECAAKPTLLAINAGSSSIRFAVYDADAALHRILHGKIDRIGLSDTRLRVEASGKLNEIALSAPDHRTAATALLDWLGERPEAGSLLAVGHRVVYGMTHSEPERITSDLLAELQRISGYDPEHMPGALALINTVAERLPSVLQVACFDTAFHRDMPRVARLLPIPRHYQDKGVCRYGFHGLSYAYLMEELHRLGDPAAQSGRVILAHLGNGASLAAIRDGRSIDTSMGFTPASGILMGSRSGDLDPGLAIFLSRTEGMSPAQFHAMTTHQSGLLGVSGISSDIRDLLACEHTESAAADAVSLFCYEVRKCIGAYAAALGGLNTLVFSGGIGENAAVIRTRICEGLDFLGIALQQDRNAMDAPLISAEGGLVAVHVIRTHEELMIARSTYRELSALPHRRSIESCLTVDQAPQ